MIALVFFFRKNLQTLLPNQTQTNVVSTNSFRDPAGQVYPYGFDSNIGTGISVSGIVKRYDANNRKIFLEVPLDDRSIQVEGVIIEGNYIAALKLKNGNFESTQLWGGIEISTLDKYFISNQPVVIYAEMPTNEKQNIIDSYKSPTNSAKTLIVKPVSKIIVEDYEN